MRNQGDKVIATARAKKGTSGTERLSALAQAGAAVLELDVNSSETSLIELAKHAWQIYGHVDVLMNNAGYMDITIMEEYKYALHQIHSLILTLTLPQQQHRAPEQHNPHTRLRPTQSRAGLPPTNANPNERNHSIFRCCIPLQRYTRCICIRRLNGVTGRCCPENGS